jgi:hypothetical protein
MRGLQVTAGTVGGLNPEEGFHSGIAFSRYTKHADRWVFGAEYLEKRYPYKKISIPQSQFTVDAGYYLKFLSDPQKTFVFLSGLRQWLDMKPSTGMTNCFPTVRPSITRTFFSMAAL